MMHTVRYLTNQLMFQRTRDEAYDNRRNGAKGKASCFVLMLYLLYNIMRGDFSEYNAKNYQEEVRHALVNLCSYSYDHEVRLAARMALDYLSARVAVSSNDLRRMLPFRRRNEKENVSRDGRGFMRVGLIASKGADPMGAYLAVQSGNIRACVVEGKYGLSDSRDDVLLEVLGEYRLPPTVHDLFVSDHHRRFFQRLHRTPHSDEAEGHRNADNMEIQASSPSYLITAGGAGATTMSSTRHFLASTGSHQRYANSSASPSPLPSFRPVASTTTTRCWIGPIKSSSSAPSPRVPPKSTSSSTTGSRTAPAERITASLRTSLAVTKYTYLPGSASLRAPAGFSLSTRARSDRPATAAQVFYYSLPPRWNGGAGGVGHMAAPGGHVRGVLRWCACPKRRFASEPAKYGHLPNEQRVRGEIRDLAWKVARTSGPRCCQ